jgi:hypothetical protein
MTAFADKFQSTERQADSTMKLRFADGTTTVVAALIGRGGIKSRVRTVVCPPEMNIAYTVVCAYRAIVPKVDAVKLPDVDPILNGHIYCGYRGYIITWPIEQDKFITVVAASRDQGEPSRMAASRQCRQMLTRSGRDLKAGIRPLLLSYYDYTCPKIGLICPATWHV